MGEGGTRAPPPTSLSKSSSVEEEDRGTVGRRSNESSSSSSSSEWKSLLYSSCSSRFGVELDDAMALCFAASTNSDVTNGSHAALEKHRSIARSDKVSSRTSCVCTTRQIKGRKERERERERRRYETSNIIAHTVKTKKTHPDALEPARRRRAFC